VILQYIKIQKEWSVTLPDINAVEKPGRKLESELLDSGVNGFCGINPVL
jgi:hypothetical protein